MGKQNWPYLKNESENRKSYCIFFGGVLATPNQHQLTLPSSPVVKGLHAGVQQFKSQSGHKFFFFFLHRLSGSYYFGQFFYLVCRYLDYTLSRKLNKI